MSPILRSTAASALCAALAAQQTLPPNEIPLDPSFAPIETIAAGCFFVEGATDVLLAANGTARVAHDVAVHRWLVTIGPAVSCDTVERAGLGGLDAIVRAAPDAVVRDRYVDGVPQSTVLLQRDVDLVRGGDLDGDGDEDVIAVDGTTVFLLVDDDPPTGFTTTEPAIEAAALDWSGAPAVALMSATRLEIRATDGTTIFSRTVSQPEDFAVFRDAATGRDHIALVHLQPNGVNRPVLILSDAVGSETIALSPTQGPTTIQACPLTSGGAEITLHETGADVVHVLQSPVWTQWSLGTARALVLRADIDNDAVRDTVAVTDDGELVSCDRSSQTPLIVSLTGTEPDLVLGVLHPSSPAPESLQVRVHVVPSDGSMANQAILWFAQPMGTLVLSHPQIAESEGDAFVIRIQPRYADGAGGQVAGPPRLYAVKNLTTVPEVLSGDWDDPEGWIFLGTTPLPPVTGGGGQEDDVPPLPPPPPGGG